MNTNNLQSKIVDLSEHLGALKVGFASADKGWEMALEGCHPRDIMPSCNSVIVIATRVGPNWYLAADFEGVSVDIDGKTYRISFLFTEWLTLKLARFLEKHRYEVVVPSDWSHEEKWIDKEEETCRLSFKLAAFEAGIGVFGRSGIIITPECGPGIRLGVLLTNAKLSPTNRLKEFRPCKDCYKCAELCPANAIDASKPPPSGFIRRDCVYFVHYLRRKTRNRLYYCGICFENCPTINEKEFRITTHGSLRSLDGNERERIIGEWLHIPSQHKNK